MTAEWLIPSLWYVVAVGGLGVTGKLALQTIPWQALIVWQGIGYAITLIVFAVLGQFSLPFVGDTWWAILSAFFAIGGLIVLYIALGVGDVSKIIPISAAYPAVTVILSAIFLSETLTVASVAGVLLVVGGVVVLTTAN